jgi:hypothetical protein
MVDHGDGSGVFWRKSSYSSSSSCFEMSRQADKVLVRDSKNPDGPVLSFDAEQFDAFIEAVKRGEFDPTMRRTADSHEGG